MGDEEAAVQRRSPRRRGVVMSLKEIDEQMCAQHDGGDGKPDLPRARPPAQGWWEALRQGLGRHLWDLSWTE